MKKIALALLLLCSIVQQAQTWQWARAEMSNGEGLSVCSDPTGNLFLCGYVKDPSVIGTFSLNPTSGYNMACLVKYNASGTPLWVSTLSAGNSTSSAYAFCVRADNNGNTYMTGSFNGTLTTSLGTFTSGFQSSAVFVSKYDASGNLLWIKSAVGTTSTSSTFALNFANSLTLDNNGNCYVGGYTNAPSIAFGTYTLTNYNAYQCFLAKYDANGNEQWVRGANSGYASGAYITSDATGNVFSVGTFSSTMVLGTTTLVSAGFLDVYIAKYDTNGNLNWAVKWGGTGIETINCISVDPSGFLYLTGAFNGVLSTGSGTVASSGQDLYVAKFDNTANMLWLRTGTSASNEYGYGLASYAGGVYVSGGMGQYPMVIGGNTLTSTSTTDAMALLHYNSSGSLIFANAYNGGGDDQSALWLDKNCDLILGGDIWTGPVVMGTTTLMPNGGESLFIAKMSTGFTAPALSVTGNFTVCGPNSTTLTASGAGNYLWQNGSTSNSIVISPTVSGTYYVSGYSNPGCSSTVMQSITVLPALTVTAVANRTLICAGESVTLTATGAGQYHWSSGANTNTTVLKPAATTTFTVSGFNGNSSCSANAVVQVSVQACLDITKSAEGNQELKIYPNPSNGFINIINLQNKEMLSGTLYNGLGEAVLKIKTPVNAEPVWLGDMPKGIYYLEVIQAENTVLRHKIIIE